MRVEALKPGTQGTWYVGRIIEISAFPFHYINAAPSDGPLTLYYAMVCVHYEGT
jgi:hypothetical protein